MCAHAESVTRSFLPGSGESSREASFRMMLRAFASSGGMTFAGDYKLEAICIGMTIQHRLQLLDTSLNEYTAAVQQHPKFAHWRHGIRRTFSNPGCPSPLP